MEKDEISIRQAGHNNQRPIVIRFLSVIILNINGLNHPFKRQIVAEFRI